MVMFAKQDHRGSYKRGHVDEGAIQSIKQLRKGRKYYDN